MQESTRFYVRMAICALGQQKDLFEQALSQGDHNILFRHTQLLASISGYHNRLIRDAIIEIQKHSDNFNRREEMLKNSKVYLIN